MTKNKADDFNGYSFDDMRQAKRMKYLAVFRGDLDLNGCYAFKSKKDLAEFLSGSHHIDDGVTVFEVDLVGMFNQKVVTKFNKNNDRKRSSRSGTKGKAD